MRKLRNRGRAGRGSKLGSLGKPAAAKEYSAPSAIRECGRPTSWPLDTGVVITGITTKAVQRRKLPAELNWSIFACNLAASLSVLPDDCYLVISLGWRRWGYVQFVANGASSLRAEAMSNNYIVPQKAKLSDQDMRTLAGLGWHAPTNLPPELQDGTRDTAGSPNFYCDFAVPVDYGYVALLAVETLRRVYRVVQPGDLGYHAFGPEGGALYFPDLGITRETR